MTTELELTTENTTIDALDPVVEPTEDQPLPETLQIEVLERLYRRFPLTIEPADLDAKIESLLIGYRKQTKMKGYRPGHAPMARIRKEYFDFARSEAIEHLAREAIAKVMKDNPKTFSAMPFAMMPSITPVQQEALVEIVDGKEIITPPEPQYRDFWVNFETTPTFTLPDLSEATVKVVECTVEDSDVQRLVTSVLNSRRTRNPIDEDEVLIDEDEVVCEYTAYVEGTETFSDKNMHIKVGTRDQAEDITKALRTMRLGDEQMITITEGSGNSSVRLKVLEANRPVVPEMSAEIIKLIVGSEMSEEDMRSKLKINMQKDADNRREQTLIRDTQELLMNSVEFDLPESLVERETDAMLSAKRQELIERRVKFASTGELPRPFFEQQARKNIKFGYIKSLIVSMYPKLTASNTDALAYVDWLFADSPNSRDEIKADQQKMGQVTDHLTYLNIARHLVSQCKSETVQLTYDQLCSQSGN